MPKDLKADLVCDQTVHILKKFMIFKDLSEREIRQILDSGGQVNGYKRKIAKLCHYKKDEIVIKEGEFDSWTFWVVKGTFDVYQNENHIASFSMPGEIFGEMSVLEGIPRTASVISKAEGACLSIDMSIVDTLKDPHIKKVIQKGFYSVILERLGKTKHQMDSERKKLEEKYSKLISLEQKIQKTAGKEI